MEKKKFASRNGETFATFCNPSILLLFQQIRPRWWFIFNRLRSTREKKMAHTTISSLSLLNNQVNETEVVLSEVCFHLKCFISLLSDFNRSSWSREPSSSCWTIWWIRNRIQIYLTRLQSALLKSFRFGSRLPGIGSQWARQVIRNSYSNHLVNRTH